MNSVLSDLKFIEEFELKDKKVFLRLDLNVPLSNGKISDDTRIQAALPTIKYCIDKGAKLVLASHLGRPQSADDKAFSLEPVAERLNELLDMEVVLVEEPTSDAPKMLLKTLLSHQVILLENLRYSEGETKNDDEFARSLASFTDIYINDAFGASHRAHASIDALPKLIQKRAYGFLIQTEVQMLEKVMEEAETPFLAILGGSKVSDKIPVIENLIDKVDGFLVGGAMAYTFLAAQGFPVGKSLLEKDKVRYAGELLERIKARRKFLHLPEDHQCVKGFTNVKSLYTTPNQAIDGEEDMAIDIGPKTVQKFVEVINQSKTILWNGPMGVFETPEYAEGTLSVAKAVAGNSGFSLVGGGDSVSAVKKSGVSDEISHISTGGGASLEFLEGKRLPGLRALRK